MEKGGGGGEWFCPTSLACSQNIITTTVVLWRTKHAPIFFGHIAYKSKDGGVGTSEADFLKNAPIDVCSRL